MRRGEGFKKLYSPGKQPARWAALAVSLLILFTAVQWVRHAVKQDDSSAVAGEAAGGKRVVLLLADRLTYTDLLCGAGPNLSRLLEEGAVALMNVRTAGAGSESGYLSFGAAARAAAGPEGGCAFGREELVEGEKAAVVFKRCTGKNSAGALLHLQAALLQERNSALPYPVEVGFLGERLKEKGFTAAVWGSADGALPGRGAVLVAMDAGGEVSTGAVGAALLKEAPFFPFGVQTDLEKINAALAANLDRAELHLVEFGDSTRLDEYWPQLHPARGEEIFTQTMENLDLLAGKLMSLLGENDLLLLAVPSLPLNRPAGEGRLAPLVLFGAGRGTPGLFGSLSTRRPGLVQNTDLAPLILSLLSGTDSISAAPVCPAASFSITPQKKALIFLEDFNRRAALVFEQRPPLLKTYIALLVLVLLLTLAGMILKIRRALRPAAGLIGALLTVPPALLLLPGIIPFPLSGAAASGLVLAGTVLLFTLLLRPLAGRVKLLYWSALGWGAALALLADTLAGAPLQQLSLLSYDPVGGARYYGMGNEYAGVLIGSALLGTISLTAYIDASTSRCETNSSREKALSATVLIALCFYGVIVFILAAPNFGANLGGCLTAAAAFGVSWAGLAGAAGGKKHLPGRLFLFLLAAAGLLWLLNDGCPGLPPSHVGLFGKMVRLRGPAGFWETVLRKMEMNLRLMRYSIWSRAFVTLVGLCAVFAVYPGGGFLKRLQNEQPYLVAGVSAALAGAAAALLTNDSGVVTAATLLLYAVPPALIAVMQSAFQPPKGAIAKNQQD